MSLHELDVQRGDLITPAWERAKQWAKSTEPILGGGASRYVRLQEIPGDGTLVTVTIPRRAWPVPFQATPSGRTVAIRPGFVNDEMPSIDGVPLDGILEDGTQVEPPRFEITDPPTEGRRSWIGIEAHVDEEGVPLQSEGEPWIRVAHRTELHPDRVEGGSPDVAGVGFKAAAMLYWNAEATAVVRAIQISHHNYEHRYVAGLDGRPGRHFFSAA